MSSGDMASLRDARLAAEYKRYRALTGLAEKKMSLAKILQMSSFKSGRALRKITLVRLLGAALDCSESTARRYVQETAALVGGTERDIGRLDIGWLLNATTAGHRYQALVDVLAKDRGAKPWEGYPYRWSQR